MERNDNNPAFKEGLAFGTAIALLETSSVPCGVEVADAVLWEAEVEMLFAAAIQPGKYVSLFTGSVESLQRAIDRGVEVAGRELVDRLLIHSVHPQVEVALRRRGGVLNGQIDALGVLETTTVASAILAADLALKTATVDLLELRIANGLGGKSYLSLTGEVSDVRSAVMAAASQAKERGQLSRDVVIPRPHPDLTAFL